MVNVNSRRTAILWSAVGFAALLMCAVLLVNSNAQGGSPRSKPVAAQPNYADDPFSGEDNPFSISAPDVQCTLNITTTDSDPKNNNSFASAVSLANYTDQALVEGFPGDVLTANEDYYRLDTAKLEHQYTIRVEPNRTNNYNLGLVVYDDNQNEIASDTDTTSYFAELTFKATSYGPYFVKVYQISAQCEGSTYDLDFSRTAPTSTPSPTDTPTPTPVQTAIPTPQPTWVTGFDVYEPNYDFSLATTIASGVDYKANFVPWGNADVDNDFYRIRVKPGLQLTCETKNLDPGVDPRMELYSGPGSQYFVMANDDISLGNFNSRVSYFSLFEGYVYVLVGQGNRMAQRDTVSSDYTVVCQLSVPGISTPAPSKDSTAVPQATATPYPTQVPATPTPEVTQRNVIFRIVQRPDPVTATPEPTGYRTFRVVAYFDTNQDASLGAGEGIAGVFVLVLSPDGNTELAQGYTDAQGQISFTVNTVGTVRVVIPLLGVDQMVAATKPEVIIRVMPPTLPNTLP